VRGIVRAMSIVRRFLLLGLSAALAVAAPGVAREAHARRRMPEPRVFPYPVHQKTLVNGLTVIVIPMPGSGMVSVRTVVRTGSRDEYEPGHTGFAHFFEHIMFRGTKRFPEAERERALTSMGASSNADTDYDRTVYQYDIAASDLERVLDLDADRFMNLSYSKEQFQTEAGAVYGEYRKDRAIPGFLLEERLDEVAFTRHTYGHTAIGFEKDVAAMPTMFDYSHKFFARYYRPENTVLLIVGDVEPEATLALADKYWSPWKKGYVPPKVPREPEQKAERKVDVAYPGRTLPIVDFAYKNGAFDASNLDYVSGLVLAEIAFGKASPLYKQLVLDEQSAQELTVYPNLSRDPGLFQIIAVVADPSKIDSVKAALEAAIKRATTELADAGKVKGAVEHLRYGFLLGLDTPENVADSLSRFAWLTGNVTAADDLYQTLTRVTPESVRAAAVKLLDARRRTVATLREKTP
jgi:zinc protease